MENLCSFNLIKRFKNRLYPMPSLQFEPHYARTTRALLQFCTEHKCNDFYVDRLKECLAALDSNDVRGAVEAFQRIPFHKEGFSEWWPPVVYPHETEEYVWAVFEGLVERWWRLMNDLSHRVH